MDSFKKFTEAKDTHKTKDGRTAKKGLWYNIHQKRKRGEAPAKPGDKDYPATLDIGEAKRKGAPKMQGDWLKQERERNREHDAAMGRTPTGRKKPVRQMTSTQRSLAQLRGESVKLDELDQDTLRSYHGKAGAELNRLKDKNAKGKLTLADLKKGQNRATGLNRSANKMEEIEQVVEGNMATAAKELETYARKNGGIDKMDFMKAAMMMKKNQKKQLDKFVDELDTEPREKILSVMQKHIKESEQLDEGILKPYHAIGKQPWSKTVKDSKGTAGEYKQIAKGKDFGVWYAYRGSNKSFPHYVVKDDKIIGSGMTVKSALKDAGLKDKDLTSRSKFADGSPLNKGMKESLDAQFEAFLNEKLKASDDMGTWVKDFQDSDAPQFKGKSQKKRQQMAVAAKLGAERDAGMREETEIDELSMSLKDITKSGNEKMIRALNKDKTKKDLEALRKRLNDRERLNKEEHGAGDEGTDELVKKFKKDTPNA